MEPPPPVSSDHEKINENKEAAPSLHCHLYDTQLSHKISLLFLPGLATACVDNTTGDPFNTPGSVASDLKTDMISYLNHRSQTFVADHILLPGSEITEPPHDDDPYDVVSSFVDDFAASKRNLFSRVSSWLLSERREDTIDDFAQQITGSSSSFWPSDHIESLSQTLLKNVDFKGLSHCEMRFRTPGELAAHASRCGYRTMHCVNEGCGLVLCENQRESHDFVCPFKMIPCEQGCPERSIMRREMDRHCITVCSMKIVNCPFRAVGCLADVRQCEMERHFVDGVVSHLMCVLRSVYREASLDDLKPRAEEIQQLSTGLSEARNARALTNLVKEIDAKLGALVIIKPKKVTDKTDDTAKKALEVAEIKEKPETAVSKEAVVEEVGKKLPEAEIAENVKEEGESKAQKLLEMETKSKAPSTIFMDKEEKEEGAETKQTRTNETRGVETKVNNMIDEENHKETKISAETKSESPSTIFMDKKENEEGAETINLSARASDEAEALSKSSEAFSKAQAETEPNFS